MKKTVLVTGGLGLLGHCLSTHLTKNYHVIVVDIVGDPDLDASIDYIQFDLTDIKNMHLLAEKVCALTSNLKVIVNNAAFNPKIEGDGSSFGKFEDQDFDELQKEVNLNLLSPLKLIQSLLNEFSFKDGKNCKVINVSSTYGIFPPNQNLYKPLSEATGVEVVKPIGYSITKAALIMATKYLAAYLGDRKINVNSVAPGGIENGQDQVFIDEYNRMVPMNRMAKPEDMLGAFSFLCGDESDYMTGQVLAVDGGWTVGR